MTGVRAYRVAYNGGPFYGYQRQPDVPTVEGAILEALEDLDVIPAAADPPEGYAAAGRTDRGVSALAQTIGFVAPDWLGPRALNATLPQAIRAWASARAPADFHATSDAAWRVYAYHLPVPNGAVDKDIERARTALATMVGPHDFADLSARTSGDTVRRVLETSCRRDGEFLVLTVRAEGFLHEMVRRIATLVDLVARDDHPLPVERYLQGEGHTGPDGIGPAPADGLVLTGVEYPNLDFQTDPTAADNLQTVFKKRRYRAATRARIMGTIHDGVT